MQITEMSVEDYDEVMALWQRTEGIGLSDADARENIERYLARNRGLSFTAREGGHLVGAVLCGHDGRRGYLHHLAVVAPHRGQGVGKALVDRALGALRAIGIRKCHLFILADNVVALTFWKRIGWMERTDLKVMSKSM